MEPQCQIGILARSPPDHRHQSATERVWRRFGLTPREASLPDPQTHTLSPRAAARPRCPKCQSRTEVQRITAARTGFEHWTLRCIKYGLLHEATPTR